MEADPALPSEDCSFRLDLRASLDICCVLLFEVCSAVLGFDGMRLGAKCLLSIGGLCGTLVVADMVANWQAAVYAKTPGLACILCVRRSL